MIFRLNKMEDVSMIAAVQTETKVKSTEVKQKRILDEKASELVVENMELGRRLAWKLLSSWNIRIAEDEVVSIVGIALCEAARNYDGRESTQFPTFFYYHLRGRLLREISDIVENKKLTAEYCHDEFFDVMISKNENNPVMSGNRYSSSNPEKIIFEKEKEASFEQAFSDLDWLEKEVITRHYFKGESLMQLADELKYCRCHLSRVKNRAILRLKKLLGSEEDLNKEDELPAKTLASSYKGGRGRRKDGEREVYRKTAVSKKMVGFVREAVNA